MAVLDWITKWNAQGERETEEEAVRNEADLGALRELKRNARRRLRLWRTHSEPVLHRPKWLSFNDDPIRFQLEAVAHILPLGAALTLKNG